VQLDGDGFRQPAQNLSGGMKRRLSLGIALIADPQVAMGTAFAAWVESGAAPHAQ
jgi:ABC-type transporter Mla maintaining outer membrane lipid asymmetry ATPase subunit MlaF